MWVIDLEHMLSNKEELELYHGDFMFSVFLKQKGQWSENQKKDLSAPLSPTSKLLVLASHIKNYQ